MFFNYVSKDISEFKGHYRSIIKKIRIYNIKRFSAESEELGAIFSTYQQDCLAQPFLKRFLRKT